MTTKAMLIIAGVILSGGCIETHTIETYTTPATSIPHMTTADLTTYTSENEISVMFDDIQITLYPDRSSVVNGISGTWVHTGTRNDVWGCAIVGSEDVDYMYVFMDQTVIGCIGDEKFVGEWFR